MTDHEAVLRNYIKSVNAVAALFGAEFNQVVAFEDFKIAMQKEILATSAYIDSLKEQGFTVPTGLEARNLEQAKVYLEHKVQAAD